MNTYHVKLSPLSSFSHFPSSDTLFGAICWGIKRIYGEKTLVEILKEFSQSPKFILSSSFPFLEVDGKHLSFYPKLITPGLFASDINEMAKDKKNNLELMRYKVELIKEYKKFKKAEYVSHSVFKKVLEGASEKELFKNYLDHDIKIERKMMMNKEEYENFYKDAKSLVKIEQTQVQKNSIDRFTMTTGEEVGETFYQQEYFTSEAFKLHFLIKTDDIEFLKPVFRYIEDKGIGGNRSTGKGRFRVDILNEIVMGNEKSTCFVTISRYIPEVSELNLESDVMYYEILPCRSKVDSDGEFKGEDIWKAKVMYLKEGSCFEAKVRKEFYGRVPIVKEIHGQKIYQNGIAFPVFGNFGGSR